MRAMRISMYPALGELPVSAFVLESDGVDTLEASRIKMEESDPYSLILTEIFEVPDDADILKATALGTEIWTPEAQMTEMDMSALFYWTVMQWVHLAPAGMIITKDPAPLDAEQIRTVMEQLMKHPRYSPKQSMITMARDLTTTLTMRDGEIIENRG